MNDPRSVLGVGPNATAAELRRARRRLAKALHPDLHDAATKADAEHQMALVNQAYDELRLAPVPPPPPASASPSFAYSSFTIDALPVDAFEACLQAAVNLGDVMRAEEPYLLAVLLDDPGPCQCLLDLVPDAGSTTVSIEIAPRHFGTCPTLQEVQQAFLTEISRQGPQLKTEI